MMLPAPDRMAHLRGQATFIPLARFRCEAVPLSFLPASRALECEVPPGRGRSRALLPENRPVPRRVRALQRGLRRLSLPALVAVALLAGNGVGAIGERTPEVRDAAPTSQPIFAPAPVREPENVWSLTRHPTPREPQ